MIGSLGMETCLRGRAEAGTGDGAVGRLQRGHLGVSSLDSRLRGKDGVGRAGVMSTIHNVR